MIGANNFKENNEELAGVATKNPKDDIIFVMYDGGCLLEYSLSEERVLHDFGSLTDNLISSLATTTDKKILFLCDYNENFSVYNLSTHKQDKTFGIKKSSQCKVTHDNELLITIENGAEGENKELMSISSINTKKVVHTYKPKATQFVTSQNCSYDNKFQFLGDVSNVYATGDAKLEIFDLQRRQSIKYISLSLCNIVSVAFTQDNLSAYICDDNGYMQLIKWKIDASSENDFDFNQQLIEMGEETTREMCITKDEKISFFAVNKSVYQIEIDTQTILKVLQFKEFVMNVKFIDNEKNVILVDDAGYLYIIDTETLELQSKKQIVSDEHETDQIWIN